jgi:hypothetical protein
VLLQGTSIPRAKARCNNNERNMMPGRPDPIKWDDEIPGKDARNESPSVGTWRNVKYYIFHVPFAAPNAAYMAMYSIASGKYRLLTEYPSSGFNAISACRSHKNALKERLDAKAAAEAKVDAKV